MMNTTTQAAAQPTTDYFVTECSIHGSRVTSDFASFRVYVEAATDCRIEREAEDMEGTEAHTDWHLNEGHECWKCCNLMVIDPYGMLDH